MKQRKDWSNYQTWSVFSWIISDEELCKKWMAKTTAAKDVQELAKELEREITRFPLPLSRCEYVEIYMQVLDWALAYVEWEEVAREFVERSRTYKKEE